MYSYPVKLKNLVTLVPSGNYEGSDRRFEETILLIHNTLEHAARILQFRLSNTWVQDQAQTEDEAF